MKTVTMVIALAFAFVANASDAAKTEVKQDAAPAATGHEAAAPMTDKKDEKAAPAAAPAAKKMEKKHKAKTK